MDKNANHNIVAMLKAVISRSVEPVRLKKTHNNKDTKRKRAK